MYSDKVMDHFMHPRNVGEIENPDGIGEVGNPTCGDMMTFYIKVKNNRLEDVKYKTFGCGAAIAVSSIASEMARGKTLEEVKKITPRIVAKELDGLPQNKFHCSNLGAQALNEAIKDYLAKKKAKEGKRKEKITELEEKEEPLFCPYCGEELAEVDTTCCQVCKTSMFYCPQCRKPVARENNICPYCATEIKGKVA
ncbi:MAG: iron-sulfur cluster assembly scaffold protein [Dehalococcoidales bacterium]|nr:iron-sulfur cluster assembly scaffold protein [Dehalococcoidales bacterium]